MRAIITSRVVKMYPGLSDIKVDKMSSGQKYCTFGNPSLGNGMPDNSRRVADVVVQIHPGGPGTNREREY